MRKACEVCGVEFNVRPAELKRGRGKYCSHSCSARANNPLGIKKTKESVWIKPDYLISQPNHPVVKPSISELKDLIKSVESKPMEVKEYTKEELMRFKRQRIRKQNGCVQEEINGVMCYVDDDGKEV